MRVPTGMLIAAVLAAVFLAHSGSTQRATSSTSVKESHQGLTVSAEAWTSTQQYKARFPKKNPLDGGAIAIEIFFQNNTNQPLRVDLDRIRLLLYPPEGDRQKLAPLTVEDVVDLIMNPGAKEPKSARPRIRLPVGVPKKSRGKQWDELEAAAQSASIATNIIEPQATVGGLLYFDLGRQFDLIGYSRLYIPEVAVVGSGKALLYFELDLSRGAVR